MILLQHLSNDITPGFSDQNGIDWTMVWHYTIIVLVILAVAVISWVLVNLLFEPTWRARFARAIGLSKK